MTLSLVKPAGGSVSWGAAVNRNFTDIENHLNSNSAIEKQTVQPGPVLSTSTDSFMLSSGTPLRVQATNLYTGLVSWDPQLSENKLTFFLKGSAGSAGQVVLSGVTTVPPGQTGWNTDAITVQYAVDGWPATTGGAGNAVVTFEIAVYDERDLVGDTNYTPTAVTTSVTYPNTNSSLQTLSFPSNSLPQLSAGGTLKFYVAAYVSTAGSHHAAVNLGAIAFQWT